MPPPPRRRALAAAALLAVLSVVASPLSVAGQQAPAGYEEGIFEVVIPRLRGSVTTLALLDATGRVLLPLRPVAEYAEIPLTLRGDSAIVLQWPPGVWETALDPAVRTLTRGGVTETLPPGSVVPYAGDVYLAPEALGTLLGAEVEVALADLIVTLAGRDDFPALRRLDVEARRDVARRAYGGLGPGGRGVEAPYPTPTGGVAADWGVSLLGSGEATFATARGALGVSLVGGDLQGGATLLAGTGRDAAVSNPFARYHRVFARPWLRQLRAGHFLTDGLVGRYVLGAGVTNEPLFTPQLFDELVIRPSIPAGWEYEVYEGDFLVGVSGRDSPDGVSTPIQYGNTPVRVRLLGPAGQERTEELVFLVPPSQVPRGALRYSAGGGACRDAACDAYGYGELRYGVTRGVTLGAGTDYVEPAAADSAAGDARLRPYLTAGGNLLANLHLELQGQHETFARASVGFTGRRNSTANATLAWYAPDGPTLGRAGWQGIASVAGPLLAALGSDRWMSLRVRASADEPGRANSLQAEAATTAGRTFVTLGYETGLQEHALFTARTFTTLRPAQAWGLRDATLAAAVGASAEGAELLELGASYRPFPRGIVSGQLRWQAGASQPSLVLSFTSLLDGAFVQSRASAAGGRASAFAGASGGIGWGPEEGVILSAQETVGQAGVAGRVFHDVDGDGVFGPGDVPVPGAVAVVRSQRVEADESGLYRTWRLRPFEGIRVGVDSLALADPSLVPAGAERRLRPAPNIFNRIDLPLTSTREVVGTVVAGADVAGVAGVTLEVVDAAGEVVTTSRTFADGAFYVPRLRPGEYELRVAASSLRALGARAMPERIPFSVPSTGEPDAVELPPITVVAGSGVVPAPEPVQDDAADGAGAGDETGSGIR